MAIASPAENRYRTMADVLRRVGNVPADRILIYPYPGTATEEDVLYLDDHEDIICELVDGILVRKPVGFEESSLAMILGSYFLTYLEDNPIGTVGGEAGMLRLSSGIIRIPDVSVILWSSIPGGALPRKPVPNQAPDLAVEILSDSNTPGEMKRKLHEYFEAGTSLVWIIDPPSRSVKVYRSESGFQLLGESDDLSGEALLPGFTLSIRKLFERAALNRPH